METQPDAAPPKLENVLTAEEPMKIQPSPPGETAPSDEKPTVKSEDKTQEKNEIQSEDEFISPEASHAHGAQPRFAFPQQAKLFEFTISLSV